jgi:O-antigen ligase
MTFGRPLRWLAIGGIFAMPLLVFVVSRSTYFPYVAGRAFAFRFIIEVVAPITAVVIAARPEYRPRGSWILVAFAAFVALLGLSNIFGVNGYRSLWGNYERMDGWILLSHLFALFLVMAAFLRTERLWLGFWLASILASLAVCGITYGQTVGMIPDRWNVLGRFSGTFGNPGYLGIYMLLSIFLTALAAAQGLRSFRGTRAKYLVLGLAVMAMAAQLFALVASGTRAALLGLVGGIVVSGIMAALQLGGSRDDARRKWLPAVFAGMIVVVCLLAFAISNLPVFDRIVAISTSQPEIQGRLLNWRVSWQGFLENPVLGWGQENYRYVLQRFFEPALYDSRFRFDRPHNIILEWLLAGGVVALLIYVSIFLVTAVTLFRSNSFSPAERSVLAGLLCAYLACNFFMFDNLASYIIFVAILAFVHWRATSETGAEAIPQRRLRASPWLAGGTALVVLAACTYALVENARALMANVALARAVVGPQFLAPGAYAQALEFRSFGTEDIRRRLVTAAIAAAGDAGTAPGIREQLVARARREVDILIARDPDYSFNHLRAGELLNASGDFTGALPYLKRAQVLSPLDQEVLVHLGQNARGRLAETEATDYFCKAYALDRSNATMKSYCEDRR